MPAKMNSNFVKNFSIFQPSPSNSYGRRRDHWHSSRLDEASDVRLQIMINKLRSWEKYNVKTEPCGGYSPYGDTDTELEAPPRGYWSMSPSRVRDEERKRSRGRSRHRRSRHDDDKMTRRRKRQSRSRIRCHRRSCTHKRRLKLSKRCRSRSTRKRVACHTYSSDEDERAVSAKKSKRRHRSCSRRDKRNETDHRSRERRSKTRHHQRETQSSCWDDSSENGDPLPENVENIVGTLDLGAQPQVLNPSSPKQIDSFETQEISSSTPARDGQPKDGNEFDEDARIKLSALLRSALISQTKRNVPVSELKSFQDVATDDRSKETVENVPTNSGHTTTDEMFEEIVSNSVPSSDAFVSSETPETFNEISFDLESAQRASDSTNAQQSVATSASVLPSVGENSPFRSPLPVPLKSMGSSNQVAKKKDQIVHRRSTINIDRRHRLPFAGNNKLPAPKALDWSFKIPKKPKSPTRFAATAATKTLNSLGAQDVRDENSNKSNDQSQSSDSANVTERCDNSTGPEAPMVPPVQTLSTEKRTSVAALAQYMSPDQFSTLLKFIKQMDSKETERRSIYQKSATPAPAKRARSLSPTSNYPPEVSTYKSCIKKRNTNGHQPMHGVAFKNVHPEWHSLRYSGLCCQVCKKSHGNSLISHYVNHHPNSEVILSRLPPETATHLRLHPHSHTCKLTRNFRNHIEYKQICYFCNIERSHPRSVWIEHISRHTGHYRHRCNHCSKWYVSKPSAGMCYDVNDFDEIEQPQFLASNLMAYICDLCNFVRFYRYEIENHLTKQHDVDATKFLEVKFLSFPAWGAAPGPCRDNAAATDFQLANATDAELFRGFSNGNEVLDISSDSDDDAMA